jgi:hypothetical protein
MSRTPDRLLQIFVRTAESAYKNKEPMNLTFFVGGFLVYGTVITREKFLEKHGFKDSSIIDVLGDKSDCSMEEILKQTAESPLEVFKSLPDFVHLEEALVVVPGLAAPPKNARTTLRLNLSAVDGFSAGGITETPNQINVQVLR